MSELKKLGKPQTQAIYERHGAKNIFGVSVADMKKIAKRIKGQQKLACELFETGNCDAMYLAGLVADGSQMTKKQLDSWAKLADWYMISEYSVPWVAIESEHGRDMAVKWIKSRKENIASTGWATYAGLVSNRQDDELDLKEIKSLLKQIQKEIHQASNRVRYTMNGFVISVGCYVLPLQKQAKATAKRLGNVEVDVGNTACKVPLATQYIDKVIGSGRAGKKRKTIKC